MRFIDLFCGLGGFHVAAEAIGARCVFACEIDQPLRDIYERNFRLTPAGDIRQINPKEIPRHDLLCAGSPCQPFSKAGGQKGFRDRVRGQVLFSVLEILRVRKPKFVLLENVPHFVRHRDGRTFGRLASALRSLGYSIDFRELSPHWFGVPQVRARMYLVGCLGSLNGFRWPEPTCEPQTLNIRSVLDLDPPDATPLSKQAISCIGVWQKFLRKFPKREKLPSYPIWSMEFGATYPTENDSLNDVQLGLLQRSRGIFGRRLSGLRRMEILEHVPSHARREHGAFPHWKRVFIEQNRALYRKHRTWLKEWVPTIREFPPSLQKMEWNCQGEERNIWQYILQFRPSGVRVKRCTSAPSLVAMTTSQVPIVAWERRFMSMRECARLQSLESLRVIPSGAAGFRALGNAVNAEVVRRILQRLVT